MSEKEVTPRSKPVNMDQRMYLIEEFNEKLAREARDPNRRHNTYDNRLCSDRDFFKYGELYTDDMEEKRKEMGPEPSENSPHAEPDITEPEDFHI